MKKYIAALALLFLASAVYPKVYYVTNANLRLDIPESWEIATDDTGFVAMPQDADFYVIVKPFGETTPEQLPALLETNLYKVFDAVRFNEEGENTLNGMDTWYGFFTGSVLGCPVGAMVSVLNTTGGYAMFLTFGTEDTIAAFQSDIDKIYASLAPISWATNR